MVSPDVGVLSGTRSSSGLSNARVAPVRGPSKEIASTSLRRTMLLVPVSACAGLPSAKIGFEDHEHSALRRVVFQRRLAERHQEVLLEVPGDHDERVLRERRQRGVEVGGRRRAIGGDAPLVEESPRSHRPPAGRR